MSGGEWCRTGERHDVGGVVDADILCLVGCIPEDFVGAEVLFRCSSYGRFMLDAGLSLGTHASPLPGLLALRNIQPTLREKTAEDSRLRKLRDSTQKRLAPFPRIPLNLECAFPFYSRQTGCHFRLSLTSEIGSDGFAWGRSRLDYAYVIRSEADFTLRPSKSSNGNRDYSVIFDRTWDNIRLVGPEGPMMIEIAHGSRK